MADSKSEDAQVPTVPPDDADIDDDLKHEQADQSEPRPSESTSEKPDRAGAGEASTSGA